MVGLTWGCRKGNRENSTRRVREQGGGGGSSGQHDHATSRQGIDHPCLAAFTQPSRTGPTATTNTGMQRGSGRSPCQTAARRRRGSGTQGWHCVCAQAAAVSVLRALAGALCACHRAACRAHLPPCVLRCWYSARTAPRSPAPGSRLPGRVAATGTVRGDGGGVHGGPARCLADQPARARMRAHAVRTMAHLRGARPGIPRRRTHACALLSATHIIN